MDLALANSKVNDTMIGLIGNSVRLAKALMDEYVIMDSATGRLDDAVDVFDTYSSESEHAGKTVIQVMMEQLGLWDLLGSSVGSVSGEISRFWGEDLANMTDAEIATAAAMIQAAHASGVWSDELTAATFASENHLGSIEMMRAEGEAAWEEQESMVDIFNDLAVATDNVATSIADLTKVLQEYTKLAMGENFFNVALQFSFGETLSEQFNNDIQALFSEMSKNGADLTADMLTSWTNQDWQSFIPTIGDGVFGRILQEQLEGISGDIDFTKVWGGFEDKESFVDAVEKMTEDAKSDVTEAFQHMEMIAYISAEWNDYDWAATFAEGTTDVQTLKNVLTSAGIEIPTDINWGTDGDFTTFLTGLTSDEITTLANYLATTGLELPVEFKDMYTAAFETSVEGTRMWVNENPIKTGPEFDDDKGTETKTDFQLFLEAMGWDADSGGYNMGLLIGQGIADGMKTKEQNIMDQLHNISKGIGDWYDNSVAPIFKKIGDWYDGLGDWWSGVGEFWTKDVWGPAQAKGGIVEARSGAILKGPTQVLAGEAGDEAFIPLEGANRKHGLDILQSIIPKYFPELAMKEGGVIGDTGHNVIGRPFDPVTGEWLDLEKEGLIKQIEMIRFLDKIADLLSKSTPSQRNIIDDINKLLPIPREPMDIIGPMPRDPKSILPDQIIDFDKLYIFKHIHGTLLTIQKILSFGFEKNKRGIIDDMPFIDQPVGGFDEAIALTADEFDAEIDATASNLSTVIENFNSILTLFTTTLSQLITEFSENIKPLGENFKTAIEESMTSFVDSVEIVVTKIENIKIPVATGGDGAGSGSGSGGRGNRGEKIEILSGLSFGGGGPEGGHRLKAFSNKGSWVIVDEWTPDFEQDARDTYAHWQTRVGDPWMFKRGGIASSPTFGMFGEAGAEALIPLEGTNKKFGERILNEIIPKYYPELMNQTGGIFGGGGGTTSYGGDTVNSESYNITGPINVTASDPRSFAEALKYQARGSMRR